MIKIVLIVVENILGKRCTLMTVCSNIARVATFFFFFNWHVHLGHEAVEACTIGAVIIVGVLGLPPMAMT